MSEGSLTGFGGVQINEVSTASGVLNQNEEYRICSDVDAFLYMDSGGREVVSGQDMLLPADTPEHILTTAGRYVLGAQSASGEGAGTVTWTQRGPGRRR